MNLEQQLKIQALVDGELPESEAGEMSALIERDPEARALEAELRNTCAALAGNETEARLPDPGDFYWSKIRREIERQAKAVGSQPRKISWLGWVFRGLVPTGALALLLIVVFRTGVTTAKAEFSPEFEVASDDVGASTFRNQETGLTMVWYYNRAPESEFTDSGATDSITQ
jgi:anti-sigma factor RsiW